MDLTMLFFAFLIFVVFPLMGILLWTVFSSNKKIFIFCFLLCLSIAFYFFVLIKPITQTISYSGNTFDTVEIVTPASNNSKSVALLKNDKVIFKSNNCSIKQAKTANKNSTKKTYKLSVIKSTYRDKSIKYKDCVLTESKIN